MVWRCTNLGPLFFYNALLDRYQVGTSRKVLMMQQSSFSIVEKAILYSTEEFNKNMPSYQWPTQSSTGIKFPSPRQKRIAFQRFLCLLRPRWYSPIRSCKLAMTFRRAESLRKKRRPIQILQHLLLPHVRRKRKKAAAVEM